MAHRLRPWGLVLTFAAAVLSQLWIEPATRIDAALMFGLFAVADGALAVALANASRAFGPARRQLQIEGAISIAFGVALVGFSVGSDRPLTLEAFYALAAGWGVLTAAAQGLVAFALRHSTSAHMLILFTLLLALTRFVYGVEQALAQEVLRVAYAQSLILMAFAVVIAFLHLLTGSALRRWPSSELEAARDTASA